MKQLILVRHAKAVDGSLHSHDFDRVLHERGTRDAAIMGKILANKNLNIDALISSPAIRAKATAELLATHLNFPLHHLQFQPLIYEADSGTLFKVVCELNDHWKTVILVGHNPAFYNLANSLLTTSLTNFPTCAICGITLQIDKWVDLQLHAGQLAFFDTPKKNYV